MSASFYDLLKYAKTGIASPEMTAYDKMRALSMAGGGAIKTLTGVPPLSFRANGKPLISWSMEGNSQQTGTPAPDAPIQPQIVGERTENIAPPMDIWLDGYVNTSGQISAQSATRLEKTSPLIQVDDSLTYFYSYESYSGYFPEGDENVAWRAIACYDTDGVFLTRIGGNGRHKIITTGENALPTGAAFVRLTLRTYGNNTNCMLSTGYKLPITNAGQTQNVYLGQVQAVRRIKKLVLTGSESENWQYNSQYGVMYGSFVPDYVKIGTIICVCTHFTAKPNVSSISQAQDGVSFMVSNQYDRIYIKNSQFDNVNTFKRWLFDQYSAGTPVTVWYVLATPETSIVNEPLCKIGDYADELHSADAGVSISTAKGANTLTVDTDLKPSEMTITYRG